MTIEHRLSALAARILARVRDARERRAHAPCALVGTITVETRDAKTGALIPEESGTTRNIVTDVGLVELAKILTKYTPATGYTIAVGTSSTAPAATDVALGAQVYEADATLVSSASTVFTGKLFLDTGDANGSTLVEAGLKHNGVLIDHSLITSIAKTAAKTVTVQVDLTLSR